jgi:hypothetical protein
MTGPLDRLIDVAEAVALGVFLLTMLLLILSPVLFILLDHTGITPAAKDRKAEDRRKKLRVVKGGKKK